LAHTGFQGVKKLYKNNDIVLLDRGQRLYFVASSSVFNAKGTKMATGLGISEANSLEKSNVYHPESQDEPSTI
jgi:hypothetical protein